MDNQEVINSCSYDNIQLINNEEPIKSKSSVILERLKKIKKRALAKNDQETIDDIDWILQNFLNNDINEPEFKIKIMDEMQKNEKQTSFDYLKEYSQQGSFDKRTSDLNIIKIKNLNFSQNSWQNMNAT